MAAVRTTTAFLATLLFVAATAAAKATEMNYVSLGGAYTIFPSSKLSDPLIPAGITVESNLNDGFAFTAAFGRRLASNFRAELEGYYRGNDLESFTAATTAFGGLALTAGASGDVTAYGAMVNGYLDVPGLGPLSPYVGVGVGFAMLDIDVSAGGASTTDDDLVTAGQAMVGVHYAVTPLVGLRLGYRLFVTSDADFSGTKAEYLTHNLEAGLIFKF